MNVAPRRRRVALLIETSNAYARGLLEGIIGFIGTGRRWSVDFPEQSRGQLPASFLRNWRGDGIIARIETPRIAAAVRRTGAPVIDVSAARHLPAVPWVETDDAAIAQAALDHFTERGFRQVAYCGEPRFPWSRMRGDHFQRLAGERGLACWRYPSGRRKGSGSRRSLERWLEGLPKPTGLMTCYDLRARQVLDVCFERGIRVPGELAVVGVDNDHFLCNLTRPPLSSVIPNTYRTGYHAAALLDRLMSGQPCPDGGHFIAPLGVETRQSSDVLAVEDPDVRAALQFIRAGACDGINVGDVLRAVPVSRRVLESRFRQLVGHTPHAEIVRLRIERAKRLLVDSDLPIAEVARQTGFSHPEYLSAAFRKAARASPRDFRRQHRIR